MAKARRNPLDKRSDETDLQYRSRLAREQETRRKAGEDIVTPETLAQGGLEAAYSPDQERARTYRRRSTSSLVRLCARGVITDDQLAAAQEIDQLIERIGRDVAVRGASYHGRVDCEGGGGAYGGESWHRVCLEQAYNRWRTRLPLPRGMILDMIHEDHQLAAIARRYNRSWLRAVKTLRDALDLWDDMRREVRDAINEDDIAEAVRRAG